MAAVIISRRAPLAKLLENLMARSVAPPPSLSSLRSFNANAQRREEVEDDVRSSLDADRGLDKRVARRRCIDEGHPFFSGVFDPFNPTRSLSQVLNLIDQMAETQLSSSARTGLRRGWDAKEDKDALHLRVDMPGLGKEHVKVSAEQNTLIIRGEGEKESEDEEAGRRYGSRIDLPEGLYRMDQIKAEMRNGVLRVTVPKVKEEERKDVFEVQIE